MCTVLIGEQRVCSDFCVLHRLCSRVSKRAPRLGSQLVPSVVTARGRDASRSPCAAGAQAGGGAEAEPEAGAQQAGARDGRGAACEGCPLVRPAEVELACFG